ncbi:MAG TPA: hypothetical protein VGA55_07875 [Bacteroidota bacterium]
MKPWWLYKFSKILLVLVLASLVLGYVVMFLWNALIPDLFAGPVLSFWQAVGLLVLSHILLRGWGRMYYGGRSHSWRKRFEEKLASMTPEEREKFKQEWKERCGWYPGMEKEK